MDGSAIAADWLPMELRPMYRTYRALADTLGTTWIAGEGFVSASSPAGHPLQNFAFAHRLTAYSARELADHIPHRSSNVYCLLSDQMTQDLLARNGFELAFRMHHLMAAPNNGASPSFDQADESRQETAEFMVRQFFQRRDAGYQYQFCLSLVGASELPLIATRIANKVAAAALLSPRVSGEPVGVFNFCVDGMHQRKGVGTQLLHNLRLRSPDSTLCVQCSSEMVSWYTHREFQPCSTILAFRNDH